MYGVWRGRVDPVQIIICLRVELSSCWLIRTTQFRIQIPNNNTMQLQSCAWYKIQLQTYLR